MATILRSDLQEEIERQLREHAQGLTTQANQALTTARRDIENQLAGYAESLNQAQQGVVQFGQQAQQAAGQAVQQPFQVLTDYANQVSSRSQQPQQDTTMAGAAPSQAAVLFSPSSGPAALPHSEEPATATDQTVAGAPGPDIGSRWKTQFDFGATYTGDYRTGTPHRGIDLVPAGGGGIGTEVDAFAPGVVTNISRDSGAGGLMVYVQDDQGLTHAYMHLAGVAPGLAVGQQVQRGTPIATMGESGTEGSPHLHYEVRRNASTGDPLDKLIDPRPYLTGGRGAQTGTPSGIQTTAGLSGGGAKAGQMGDQGQSILSGAADIASWLGNEGQKTLQAILVTEGGLAGARGDSGRSAGPLQFFEGGQLLNFANAIGMTLNDAKRYVEEHPLEAIQWAIGTIGRPGYLGQAIADGISRNLSGPDLATYAQQHGQVSESPERAGQNWQALFGQGADLIRAANEPPFRRPPDTAVAGAPTRPGETIFAGEREQPQAKAPLIFNANQDVAQNPLMQQFQVIQDQVDELRKQLDQYNRPPLAEGAPARQAVEQGLGQLGQNLPTFDEQERQRRIQQGYSPEFQQRATQVAEAGRAAQPSELTIPSILGGAARAAIENPPSTGISLGEYQQRQTAIGQAIEQGNPLRDVPFVGGLTSQAAEFGMSGQWLLPFGAVTRTGEEILAAAGVARPIVQRIGGEALSNALQNAIYEVTSRTDATPESVGEAFVTGGALGALMPLGTAAVRRVGQEIISRAPDLGEMIRYRQPAQAEVGFAMGRGPGRTTPPAGDVLEGMAVPRTGYEPGTPEALVEDRLAAAARQQNTPRPNLTQAEIRQFPGLSESQRQDLNEVREAIEAGLPAARWYQDLVGQIRADTGQDINPREAAVLMGAFGGNAGVTPNYHAMLSLFDAMRQARPDLAGLERMDVPQIMATQAFKDVQGRMAADATYADWTMVARVMRGYRTGEIPVPSGAKLSSYTQNFLHALNDLYDPYSTQDIWQGRLFGNEKVSNNDAAYRSMHALTNWLAREMHLRPKEAQAAAWTVYRTLYTAFPQFKAGNMTLRDAIAQGYASGLLHPPSMRTAGVAEVAGPRGISTWLDKVNDVRDRIRQNGSYNAAPPDSATALNEWALYHPNIQSAAQQRATLDPSGFQYGKVAGPKVPGFIQRPVGNGPAGALRDLAVMDSPILRVPGGINDLDQNGKIRWLQAEHEVQHVGGTTYVNVPGIGDDAAQVIGQRLGADLFNHADPRSTAHGGVAIDGLVSQSDQAAAARALQGAGLPVIREQVGTGIRVPAIEGDIRGLAPRVLSALERDGVQHGGLTPYNGETHAVQSAGAPGVRGVGAEPASGGGPLGVSAGNELRDQRIRAAVFRDAEPPAGPGALPPQRGPVRARQRGEANLPFSVNVLGGAAGAYAGNVATPEDADVQTRLRNIGLGALTGLAGTHLATRGGGRLETAAERAGRAPEGFRAPGRGIGDVLRATTQEPPGGPGGAREPRTLGEVQTNRWAVREARAGETAMSPDERAAYMDQLEQRQEDLQNRFQAVDEMVRNPSQKVERPPWAAGYTNRQLAELARRAGISPYEEAWWDKVGLSSGSGEVREDVGQSGLRGAPSEREPTPTELRRERNDLAKELRDVQAAAQQLIDAPDDARLVRSTARIEAAQADELPFDNGAPPEAQPVPIEQAGGGADEGARLAQEIVIGKGRLSSDAAQVVGEKGGIIGRGIVHPEAVVREPPSAETKRLMPNLDALLGKDMPEVAAQIQKAAEDNPELMAAYKQGRISWASLKNDLAARVGMSMSDWLKTPIGKGFNQDEMVALQAAAVESQVRSTNLAQEIIDKGGVDRLSDEELAFSLAQLTDAKRLIAVAGGGRSTAGRTLNALKIRMTAGLASDITARNESRAAKRMADQARRASKRATTLLEQGRDLENEAKTARTSAREQGAPRNILQQIDDAYAQLDRYQAMTLHEKEAEFNRLAKERADRAAARKEKVRSAPEELLSALKAELAAERDNFAKRKDRWETMAFWDSKAGEIAAEKRQGFRAGLYIEQQRRAAQLALKRNEEEAARAFDRELARRGKESERAGRLLEAIGGKETTKEQLAEFVKAVSDPDPMTAIKYLKGTLTPSGWRQADIMRRGGLLSGFLTHQVNVGGNIIRAVAEVADRPVVVGIDALRSALGIEKEVGRQAHRAELLPMLTAYGPGVLHQLGNVGRVLKTGVTPLEMMDLKNVQPGFTSRILPFGIGPALQRTGLSSAVDVAMEAPFRALQAEDILARGPAHSAHALRVAIREAIAEGYEGAAMHGRAANIVQNLENYPLLAKEADEAAAHMVFQERRRGIPRISTTNEGAQFGMSLPLPFKETPTNITAQGLGRTPLGFAGAWEAARGAREMPTGTAAERAARGRQVLLTEERMARAINGSLLLGGMLWLGNSGMLTGGYPSDQKESSTLPQGWRAYSFRLQDPLTGNTSYIPFNNFGSLGWPMAVAAILTDPIHRGRTVFDNEEILPAVTALGRYTLDTPFLQGMADLVDALQDPKKGAAKFAEPLVASFGPFSGMGREMQRWAGVATRNPHEGLQGLVEAWEANYPGLSGNVPPSLTPLGEERTQAATGPGRLMPFRYDIERDQPTLQALRTANVGVPATPKEVGVGRGYTVELTEDERATLQRERGAAIVQAVAKERAKDRVAGWERTLQTAPSNSAEYKDALVRYNGALQAAVSGAAQTANNSLIRQWGRDQVQARMKPGREVEPAFLGAPPSLPVGELEGG